MLFATVEEQIFQNGQALQEVILTQIRQLG